MQQWVIAALAHAGLSQSELSRRLAAKLRRTPDHSIINKFLKSRRDISADELIAIEEITGHRRPVESASKIKEVPVVSWVSAGRLADASNQVPVNELPLLAFADLGRGDFFALRVEGDSMDRVSPEGSIIVVNRSDRELVSDRCYIFAVRGETTYKRWHADPPYLAPFSTNAMHEPIFIKKARDMEVVGRVRRTVLDL
jgi:SOS-response transcriptional repressor LexA